MFHQRTRALVALALVSALTGQGCSGKRVKLKPQDEVGTVHVAVQSVAPFEAYVDSLQPTFTLTPDDALRKAVPVTQLREIAALRAFAASLRVALPTLSLTQQDVTQTEGGTTTATSSQTRTSSSGSLEDVPAPPAPAAPAATPHEILSGTSPEVDPLLQYRAAASLLQEVALLSSYVRDAAIRRGTVPFVVRLLVTILPGRERVPYHAEESIAFFAEADSYSASPLHVKDSLDAKSTAERDLLTRLVEEALRNEKQLVPVEVLPLFVTDGVESSMRSVAEGRDFRLDSGLSGSVGSTGLSLGGGAQSTDTDRALGRPTRGIQTVGRSAQNILEARFGASYADDTYSLSTRTYSVTLLLLAPSLARWSKSLEKAVATETDTPGKTKDAAVALGICQEEAVKAETDTPDKTKKAAAALGIRQEEAVKAETDTPGKTKKAADALGICQDEKRPGQDSLSDTVRRHLRMEATQLVPLPSIRYATVTSFRHAETGQVPEPRSAKELQERITRLWNDRRGNSSAVPNGLEAAVRRRDFSEFADLFGGGADAVWPDFVRALQADGRGGGTFTLPRNRFLFFSKEAIAGAVVEDDGESMKLLVTGAQGLTSAAELVATLKWPSQADSGSKGEEMGVIRSSSFSVSQDGKAASFVFPSLSKLKLCRYPKPDPAKPDESPRCQPMRADVTLTYRPDVLRALEPEIDTWIEQEASLRYALTAKVPATQDIALTVPSPVVLASSEGKGSLVVELKKSGKGNVEPAALSVEGAEISAIEGKVEQRGVERLASPDQVMTVRLANLVPGTRIRIHVKRGDVVMKGSPADVFVLGTPEKPETKDK